MYYLVVNISDDAITPSMIVRNTYDITDRKERPEHLYTSQDEAIRIAQEKAAKNPTKEYAVCQTTLVFSTGKPKIVTKEFNEQGELIEKKEKANV